MNHQDLTSTPDVLTITDLQKTLNVGRSTAYRLVNSGDIGCVRIGRSIRIPRKYVSNFLQNNSILLENEQEKCYNKEVTADKKAAIRK